MARITPVRLVQPKIWEAGFDYWSMQIAAVLLCLHEHKNLSIRPDNQLGQNWEHWSLNEFAGRVGAAALTVMKGHIQAWGAQYLLADYLNRDEFVKNRLLEELGHLADRELWSCPSECYVSGVDSRAGIRFLESCGAKILGDERRKVKSSYGSVAKFADLCIVISLATRKKLAVFGEVEGIHGEKLLQNDFWLMKGPFALFGIGLLQCQEFQITIQRLCFDKKERVILLLGKTNQLLADFDIAIEVISNLMSQGPKSNWWRGLNPGLADVVKLVVEQWACSVKTLLDILARTTECQAGLTFMERKVATLSADPIQQLMTKATLPSIIQSS